MSTTIRKMDEVSPGLLSRAMHALKLDANVPGNDRVYPVNIWEDAIETLGSISNCTTAAVARAKAMYTYYMLYHYAPVDKNF